MIVKYFYSGVPHRSSDLKTEGIVWSDHKNKKLPIAATFSIALRFCSCNDLQLGVNQP